MKRGMTGWASTAACCLASVAMAATVTIAPGNGVATNVSAHDGRGGRSRVRHRQVRRHGPHHPLTGRDAIYFVPKREGRNLLRPQAKREGSRARI